MVYIKIHCAACGGTWDVFSSIREFDQARTCPHCGQRIDADTWRNYVLPAFEAVKTANEVIYTDHIQHHTGAYAVDFIADSIFENARRKLNERR